MLNDCDLTPNPTPPRPRRVRIGRLNDLLSLQKELRRVYIDMRTGKIATQDGTRLAFVLATIARIIEGSEHEQRIAQLEAWIVTQRQKT